MNKDASLEDVMSSEFAINLISYASALIIMMGIGLVIMWILVYLLDVHAGRRSIGFPRTKVVKEPITKTDRGYYVKTADGERVFVSYAELYPNDPNRAL
ncbi:hypothetical protein [Paenibacillus polymyxa]|uniref:hypothetical protein n=1 Tax=Paenibacillus polymyxa TaxID=1406 RepID=UPI0025B654D3|nr:hypothetical protein [Paenibacillus polymyxa]MDN4090939.1 hypothetical protein [Paenibacillus polymyxa]